LQTSADLDEFPRRKVDALSLGVRLFLLAVGTRTNRRQLPFDLPDVPRELSQLASDKRGIRRLSHRVSVHLTPDDPKMSG
jgi:hypothetical protein